MHSVPRIGPCENEREVGALHGAGMIVGHRRGLSRSAQYFADRAADGGRVVAAERVAVRQEMPKSRSRVPRALRRVAVGAEAHEHGMRTIECFVFESCRIDAAGLWRRRRALVVLIRAGWRV